MMQTNDCSVTYQGSGKPTVYIIFLQFHRDATSVLLPPSDPEAITLPSRTQTSIFIKKFINRCMFQVSLTLPPRQLPALVTSVSE